MGLPSRRVLAEIRRENQETQLWFRGQRLSLDRLAPDERSSLARWPTTIVIEADVQGLVVIALGDTRPHPRTAALRAVADLRFDHAREAFGEWGDAIEGDLELLLARLQMHARTGKNELAESNFLELLALPDLTLESALTAFESLWSEELKQRCASVMAGYAERAVTHGRVGASELERLMLFLPREHWGTRLPFLAIAERLRGRDLSQGDLTVAEEFLAAVKETASQSDLLAAAAQIDSARKAIEAREAREAAALLRARPNFDEVEQYFGVKLPPALRLAWEAHYEGRTVGFGFLEVKKGKLEKVGALAKRLARALEPHEQRPLTGLPYQLLPFGVGEHDGDYFALDLAAPFAGTADFAVRGIFNRGTGGGVLAYPSSAAWLAADGHPIY